MTDDIGDSFRTAQVLTLDDDLSAVVQSQIDGRRDKDMFVFTAPADGQLQIDMTTPGSELDSYLYLYDSRGHRLAEDDDSGEGTDARIVFTMEAGSQYYIRADAFRRSTGSYTLKLQELTQETSAVDDFGNSLAEAAVLVFAADGSTSQTGRIDWPNDQDMFVFTAVASGLMQIDMTT
ncbi:MAG: PPC domain-containing protein, partial [Sedimentisphaerales bacterium]|nr:PPC domain-containing protein [Sedimentisphaerales bacterium]